MNSMFASMKTLSIPEYFEKELFTDHIQNNIEIINSTTSIDHATDIDFDALSTPKLTIHLMNQGINEWN